MTLPPKSRKGHGAISNPQGRFESRRVEAVDDGWTLESDEEPPPLATTVTAEHAKSIISHNNSPDIPFEQSINPYRGCGHACVYCVSGDSKILLVNGRTRLLGDIRTGDEIIGSAHQGPHRRYVKTRVVAHWATHKPAYRLLLADGTSITASGEHRFLSAAGWKFVSAAASEPQRRAHLITGDKLLGIGMAADPPVATPAYRRGYLCAASGGADYGPPQFATAGGEVLQRSSSYFQTFGIQMPAFSWCEAAAPRTRARVGEGGLIDKLIAWPGCASAEWVRGFLAGTFDAAGSYGAGWIRISATNHSILDRVAQGLKYFGFGFTREKPDRRAHLPVHGLRLLGGMRAHLRFLQLADPAVAHKRSILGQAVESQASLDVVEIEPLGKSMPMFDITTGTGDFIANGVVSHNFYARPAHSYVNLSPGLDFETKLFYKENAAQLLREELSRPRYVCKSITLGANTDPYQPIERKLKVTRSILEVLQEFRHPVSIVTKGHLIERDLDILAAMARENLAAVHVSVTTLDSDLKRILEPRAPAAAARLHAIRSLHAAGVPVGALVAPVIPAINDHEIEHILEAVAQAGARSAGYVLLRLPYEVKDLFREWLAEHYPLRAAHVMSLVNDLRGGRDNDPNFGSRMRGIGPFADLMRRRFEVTCRKLNLNAVRRMPLDTLLFRPPPPAGAQLDLGF
jgi:DNA repair photolyase